MATQASYPLHDLELRLNTMGERFFFISAFTADINFVVFSSGDA